MFRFALIPYDRGMTVALPFPSAQWLNDALTEKDLWAETDLARLLQQSDDFGRWGESEEWERDLLQVIKSLSDFEDGSRSWDLGRHALGPRSATMERSYPCLVCARPFQVTGCLPQAEVTDRDIEVTVACPFCDELNIVLWPRADRFLKISQE